MSVWTPRTAEPVSARNAEGFNVSNMRHLHQVEPLSGIASTVPPGTMSTWNPPTVKAYSPTQTERFLKCPMLWWLKQHGWESSIQPWTPNKLIGSAVHAGLAQHYQGHPLEACHQALAATLHKGYVTQEEWPLDRLEWYAQAGLKLGRESSQLQGKAVVASELEVEGRRVDVVLRGPEGLLVDEVKVALSLEARYIPDRLAAYEHSWQLRDYAYHVGQHFHEPVVQTRIVLIVLGPRRQVLIYPCPPLSQEALAQWYQEAFQVWMLMAEYELPVALPPWKNLTSCTDRHQHFGRRCEMFEACHELGGDETKMPLYYRQEREEVLYGL